jgi:hypothetical protein
MAGVLLISEGKLKQFTNINSNVPLDTLRAEIQIAQDIELQPLLGTLFYNTLLSKVSSTGNTLNADETTLVNDYIQPFLIQVSYFNAIPHLHYRTMNRGIVEGQMESASSVDIETMKYLRSIQKQRSDFYKQRLLDYLILGNGQGKFPQYETASTQDGMIPDRTAKYNNPIVLNHTSRKGWSLRNIARNMSVYSELEQNFKNCPDCY